MGSLATRLRAAVRPRLPADVREHRTAVQGRAVRSLSVTGPARPAEGHDGSGPPGAADHARPLVVVLPGLGLPGYTLPTARALAARGVDCAVLDLPGFGSSLPDAAAADIDAVGRTAAAWVESAAAGRPVVVMGHSTGSQAALTAALALGERPCGLALVLAGPTFTPSQRRVPRLVAAVPRAYRKDPPSEVHASEILRGRGRIASMLRSGLHDAPERRIADLRVPVTVTAGVHDAFAPVVWLDLLARSAHSAPRTRTSLLPGSHNNLWTHPDEVADLVVLAVADVAPTP